MMHVLVPEASHGGSAIGHFGKGKDEASQGPATNFVAGQGSVLGVTDCLGVGSIILIILLSPSSLMHRTSTECHRSGLLRSLWCNTSLELFFSINVKLLSSGV